jgi:hypothetical protein
MFSGHRLHAAAVLAALLAAACSDASTAPDGGRLNLGVRTSGGDIDIDGYEFVVDSSAPRYVSTSGVAVQADGTQRVGLTLSGVKPGTHVVSLKSVADNCTVTDANPRSVAVAVGDVASVEFSVVCVATGIAITTHTTGLDQPFAYDLRVDGTSRPFAPNDSQAVSRLAPGPHTISLNAPPANCRLATSTQNVVVSIGTITRVRFDIDCTAIVRLEKIAYSFDMPVGQPAGGATQRTIGLINPDGSGASVIGAGDAPSWSPDGRRLVFSEASCTYYDPYYGYSCSGGLVIVDPDMGGRTSILGVSGAFDPAWSPTGDVIALTRCCENGDRNRIYLVTPDGSQVDQLTIPQVVTAGSPGWSPDGKRIAFTCSSTGSLTDLCVIDRTGSGFERLTTNISVASRPAWKPDGTSIAFSALGPGIAGIAVLDLATRAVSRVANGSQPAWNRDGSRIVFSGSAPPGLYTLSVLGNIDGSFAVPLTSGAYGSPAWRP